LARRRIIDTDDLYFDVEIVELLGAKGLHLYIRLWGLAEDWGGYEPNYKDIALKMGALKFTSRKVEADIRKLIDARKIVPYSVNGQEMHWIRNLLKRQPLNNPAPPRLPVPPWVRWEKKKYDSGKHYAVYRVDEQSLKDYLNLCRNDTGSLPVGSKETVTVTETVMKEIREVNSLSESIEVSIVGNQGSGASGSPSFDEDKEKEEFHRHKEHLMKQCSVLMDYFGITRTFDPKRDEGRFHPMGFVFFARK
jgi:hypothetical protein